MNILSLCWLGLCRPQALCLSQLRYESLTCWITVNYNWSLIWTFSEILTSLTMNFSLSITTIFISILSSANCLDCTFAASYPKHTVTYKLDSTIDIDGKLDEAAWSEVGWSEEFVDISTTEKPRLKTRMKMRWDEDWLYVAAQLEETQIWANITETCHCINEDQDQVIFHDNDFEIFIDVDGSNHNYKEFEVNAANATWILLLDKPYTDGGYENSSRVFGAAG